MRLVEKIVVSPDEFSVTFKSGVRVDVKDNEKTCFSTTMCRNTFCSLISFLDLFFLL